MRCGCTRDWHRRLLRELRPASCTPATWRRLSASGPAWAAGVPVRMHGEHGRDVEDLDGSNRKLPADAPALPSVCAATTWRCRADLGATWRAVGVAAGDVTRSTTVSIPTRFRPAGAVPHRLAGCPFDPAQHWLVGTVGRMQAVKDQVHPGAGVRPACVDAGARAARHARLVMVGDGPLRAQVQAMLDEAGVSRAGLAAWRAPAMWPMSCAA
jgi:hypothetical protein